MNYATAEQLTAFEDKMRELFNAGELPSLLHLSGGNEAQLVDIFKRINEGDWVFASHRSHLHALLAGIPPERVEKLICEDCSMFIFDKARNFYSSAILGGTACIAAGVAWSIKHSRDNWLNTEDAISRDEDLPHVWCFFGDGAEDEGHVYEAIRFVTGWDLPCTFVIEDNDRSVDTDKICRRGPHAKDFDWQTDKVIRYHYKPTYPHAGRGQGPMVTFKRTTPLTTP